MSNEDTDVESIKIRADGFPERHFFYIYELFDFSSVFHIPSVTFNSPWAS